MRGWYRDYCASTGMFCDQVRRRRHLAAAPHSTHGAMMARWPWTTAPRTPALGSSCSTRSPCWRPRMRMMRTPCSPRTTRVWSGRGSEAWNRGRGGRQLKEGGKGRDLRVHPCPFPWRGLEVLDTTLPNKLRTVLTRTSDTRGLIFLHQQQGLY